jgi:hypothetical protein
VTYSWIIELDCHTCEAVTEHKEEGDERICTVCENVNQYLDADSEGYFWRNSYTNVPTSPSRQ